MKIIIRCSPTSKAIEIFIIFLYCTGRLQRICKFNGHVFFRITRSTFDFLTPQESSGASRLEVTILLGSMRVANACDPAEASMFFRNCCSVF
mmetsp:Transcript_27882/g.44831  ORF Transcript_27882/g.44831 Transcript_27882/m.44831 type:complete len:92 (-) Transcript_27882:102-377(-)